MKLICITGLDGSGKSTQVKRLSESLPNSRIVSVWDIIRRPEFQPWSIYKSPPDVEKYVMNLSPTSRSLFVFHSFNEAYESALKSDADYLIFDSYWYKYLAIEQAMGCSEDFSDFVKTQYKEPDLVIYLDLPNDQLIHRKPKISYYESGNKDKIDYPNFLRIQKKAKVLIEGFLPTKTVWIDAQMSIDEIGDVISEIIKNSTT